MSARGTNENKTAACTATRAGRIQPMAAFICVNPRNPRFIAFANLIGNARAPSAAKSCQSLILTKVATVATLIGMKAVGVKTLKNNLSRYLRDVQAGETVWVTDRDEVIAEIHRPTTVVPGKISRWESWLNDQERRGKIRKAEGRGPSIQELQKMKPWPAKISIQSQLDDSRTDRG